jgi:hypothetical protein
VPAIQRQSLRFIDGLITSISTYLDYKNHLSNSLTVTGVNIYSVTLVAAINSVTKFHRGTKASQPTILSGTAYTSLAAAEDKTKGKPRGGRDKKPKSGKGKPNPDSNLGVEKEKDWKSKIKCHNCGKLGYLKEECRGKKKDTPPPTRNASAAIADNVDLIKESSFYSTFGQMHDKEDNTSYQESYCNITLTSTPGAISTLGAKIGIPADQNSIQPTTEIIFDTGAHGSIVANEAILACIPRCEPTEYNGLSGSLSVSRTRQLRDIGIVHFDRRAKLSILSASDCLRQGHQ